MPAIHDAQFLNDTYKTFVNACLYTRPLSYDEWMNEPDDRKAAFLYVQFFDDVCAAWARSRADYVDDEDLIEVEMQYLQKNVDIIKKDKKRFTRAYIYQISYNCMDCIRYIQKLKDKGRYETDTILNATDDSGKELSVLDLVGQEFDIEAIAESDEFWAIIRNMGMETEKVVQHLISDMSLRRVSKSSKAYASNPFRDIAISEEKKEKIIEELRRRLRKYNEVA